MTETDRELLMWAAKAAGIECGIIHGEIRIRCDAGWTPWNPLTDDGDALRLAVKCGISVLQFPTCIGTRWPQSGINPPYEEITSEQDALVATRRAIVRAAAEIGKNMK